MTGTSKSSSRTKQMAATASKDTRPELRVRRLLRDLGYGYRLHVKDLPGKPDIVLRKYNKAIVEVRGCFWHAHGCDQCRLPQSNLDYWEPKLQRNRERDAVNEAALRRDGWRILVLWECELDDEAAVRGRLTEFLEPS